jgi:RNA polymerase sigma factor (sigma-70 family)
VTSDRESTLPPELSALLTASDAPAREAAWAAFVERYSRLLLHTARSSGGDYDAVMDAYTWALEQLRRDDLHRLRAYAADRRCKFTTWLVVVVRRLCLDHHRQRYGRAGGREASSRDSLAARRRLVDLVTEDIDPSSVANSAAGNPDADLEAKELGGALSAAIGNLPPRERLLLKLRFEDDLSAREIAQVMGFATAFHVYRQLNRLVASLRASLRKRGVDATDL